MTHVVVTLKNVPLHHCFNFTKTNWQGFSNELQKQVEKVDTIYTNYGEFTKLVHKGARNNKLGPRADHM